MKPFSVEELRARVGNLVTMKRAREVLQQELATQLRDLEALARETAFRWRELRSALEALRVARDQAEQASRVKSDFIRMVSHELRTPLNSINGYLQILQRQPTEALTDRQRQIVERIAGSSARLLDLIESLLEYAGIQSGRLQITVGTFAAAAVAAAAVEDMRSQAERRGLELQFHAEPHLPPLHRDARLVRLIATNLVSNAIKYTERGTVEVSVSTETGRTGSRSGTPGRAFRRMPRLRLALRAGSKSPWILTGCSIWSDFTAARIRATVGRRCAATETRCCFPTRVFSADSPERTGGPHALPAGSHRPAASSAENQHTPPPRARAHRFAPPPAPGRAVRERVPADAAARW
jgi:signal transduction histidine kinase